MYVKRDARLQQSYASQLRSVSCVFTIKIGLDWICLTHDQETCTRKSLRKQIYQTYNFYLQIYCTSVYSSGRITVGPEGAWPP